MKAVMAEFAAIEAINQTEEEAREALMGELRRAPCTWEYYCGIAEGVNMITRLYPFSNVDTVYRATVRLVMIATARLALESIQEEEDLEGFPEEL